MNAISTKTVRNKGARAFWRGLRSYTRVPAALSRHRLWHYQLLPAAMSLVLSAIVLTLLYYGSRGLAGWLDAKIELPGEWLDQMFTMIVGVGLFVTLLLAFLFIQKHIVIVLLAPFLSMIAEKITRAEIGPQPNQVMGTWLTLRRSAIINTRSILLEIISTLALLLLGLIIPPLSPFTSALALWVQSRYAGIGLMDFPLEYRGMSAKESIAWSAAHKATAAGVGAGYVLLMFIPIFGWLFAPTFGTVAGTLCALEEMDS